MKDFLYQAGGVGKEPWLALAEAKSSLDNIIVRQMNLAPVLIVKFGSETAFLGTVGREASQSDRGGDAARAVGVLDQNRQGVGAAGLPGRIQWNVKRVTPSHVPRNLPAIEIDGAVVIHGFKMDRPPRPRQIPQTGAEPLKSKLAMKGVVARFGVMPLRPRSIQGWRGVGHLRRAGRRFSSASL